MMRKVMMLAMVLAACGPVSIETDAGRVDAGVIHDAQARNRFAGRWIMQPTQRTMGSYHLIFTSERGGSLTIYVDDCYMQLSSEVLFTMEPVAGSDDEYIVNVTPCAPYPSRCRAGMVTPTCERLQGVPFVSGERHRIGLYVDTLSVHGPNVTYRFTRAR